MKNKLTACVVVVVAGLMVAGGALFSGGVSRPIEYDEVELKTLNAHKRTFEMFVADGLLSRVEVHEKRSFAKVWVDSTFREKTNTSQSNLIQSVFNYIKTRQKSEYFISIDLYDSETDEKIGTFSGGQVHLK